MNKKFCENLKYLREEKKLSFAKFSDAIKISASVLFQYEKGEKEPGLSRLIMLADFFDVTLDYLTGREDNTK